MSQTALKMSDEAPIYVLYSHCAYMEMCPKRHVQSTSDYVLLSGYAYRFAVWDLHWRSCNGELFDVDVIRRQLNVNKLSYPASPLLVHLLGACAKTRVTIRSVPIGLQKVEEQSGRYKPRSWEKQKPKPELLYSYKQQLLLWDTSLVRLP